MSKQIKLYRQSGRPVNEADSQAYEAEWKLFYDKAAERAKLDILKLQRFLSFGERLLVRKHNKEVLIDLPKSEKAWRKLVSDYHDTPIMIAKTQKGDEIVAILMDQMQG